MLPALLGAALPAVEPTARVERVSAAATAAAAPTRRFCMGMPFANGPESYSGHCGEGEGSAGGGWVNARWRESDGSVLGPGSGSSKSRVVATIRR
ncbi:hypothetical protein GCM10009668_36840 [Nocardioides dubius]|uniref:Uncharacterized protein n=1 Tax=Nocardioides dubius TaxID=317019 RepID=A0ABP4EL02_9ACTN